MQGRVVSCEHVVGRYLRMVLGFFFFSVCAMGMFFVYLFGVSFDGCVCGCVLEWSLFILFCFSISLVSIDSVLSFLSFESVAATNHEEPVT